MIKHASCSYSKRNGNVNDERDAFTVKRLEKLGVEGLQLQKCSTFLMECIKHFRESLNFQPSIVNCENRLKLGVKLCATTIGLGGCYKCDHFELCSLRFRQFLFRAEGNVFAQTVSGSVGEVLSELEFDVN